MANAQKPGFSQDELILFAKLLEEHPSAPSLAHSEVLLNRYGSVAEVLRSCGLGTRLDCNLPRQLEDRIGELKHCVSQLIRQEGLGGPVISTADVIVRTLRSEMAHLPRETFRVLFLDSSNHLLADETMWEGTVNKVQIHTREVVRRALETGATALLLVHNHPSGDPRPSRHDVAMTNQLIAACTPLDVVVHDHLIVARRGWFSMTAHRLITPNSAGQPPMTLHQSNEAAAN